MGVQFGTYASDQGTPAANFGASVDGNYGFGDGCIVSLTPLPVVFGSLNPATGECATGTFTALPGGRDYLVTLANGKSVVPMFHLFTDVPVPARMWGLIVDDLTFSADKKSLLYGEKAGVAFAPVGIYDYTDRLITTVESDYNGLWDVLLPSSNRINCPTPSGVCANLYRFVGNDPGVPGRLNLNYNPRFRTISAEFEAIPGLLVPADLAPSQVGVTVQLPGGQPARPVSCSLDNATPQLFAVSKPYVDTDSNSAARSFTIDGTGFGSTEGTVSLGGVALSNNSVTSWSNTQIRVTLSENASTGPRQLTITATNGQSTVNGLTMHVLYEKVRRITQQFEVGPERLTHRQKPCLQPPITRSSERSMPRQRAHWLWCIRTTPAPIHARIHAARTTRTSSSTSGSSFKALARAARMVRYVDPS
ncbi:MAG: hypothetical protein IPP88_21995 [Betaproteobacteria bacterium]|nr:hypothetical protein [Betaproteobacteria bacterium]